MHPNLQLNAIHSLGSVPQVALVLVECLDDLACSEVGETNESQVEMFTPVKSPPAQSSTASLILL